jgi:hypothetical protein
MLSWARYRWKLHNLNAEKRAVEKRYERLRKQAKKEGKSAEQIYELDSDGSRAEDYYDGEIDHAISGYLNTQAHYYRIPAPRFDDKDAWIENSQSGRRHLTVKAIYELKAAIRKEQNDRWQYWEMRARLIVPIATALTGLIGAMIGWIAFWK